MWFSVSHRSNFQLQSHATLLFTCCCAEVSGRTESSGCHVRLPDADSLWLHCSDIRLSLWSAQRARPTPCCLVSRAFYLQLYSLTAASTVCLTFSVFYCGSELILLPLF